MTLKLIIGNKNYSSWSMRPWIAMKVANIPFEETVISLDAPDFKAVVGPLSGTGKVPALIDGDVRVWNHWRSLNIWRRSSPKPVYGRRTAPHGRSPEPFPTRCMRVSCRCVGLCR